MAEKREALEAIVGRLMNVEIDLQTGATKAVVAKRLREITNDLHSALPLQGGSRG